MIEQLISRVFYARNVAHFEHWRATGTGSFSKHMALGSFYDDIIDAIDSLVEAYQGAFELIGNIPAPATPKGDVLSLLEADAAWIEENHEDICKGNRAVANLIDTLTGVYLSTIYKLRNLK
jgi:DNA-binding ferritin-like protein